MKLKILIWIGSSKYDLSAFPRDVKQCMGHALCLAQGGEQHVHTKPLKGFSGATA
jgi:phage-related protein